MRYFLANNPHTRLHRLKARRAHWLQVHLYLGLIAGAVLAVVGFTGAILVFYEELQELLNAEQISIPLPPPGQQNLRSLDEIVAAADAVKPPASQFFKVYYPRHPGLAYKLLYTSPIPGASDGAGGDGYYIFVNPYRAAVSGQQLWHPYNRYWGRPLLSFIMQLHYCLLLDDVGVIAVGIIAALLVISVLTGVIVWWPLTGKFRQALGFKRNASAVRFNVDLHKLLGLYTAVVLVVLLLSGVYFNLPATVNTLAQQFATVQRPNAWEGIDSANLHSQANANQHFIGYAAAEAAVNRAYPSGRLWMLEAPHQTDGTYRIAKRDAAEISGVLLGYRDFAVDAYSGALLQVYSAGAGSAADSVFDAQWPLHSGQAFGWTGRLLVFITGLACPVLYITGLIRWRQKRRAAQYRTAR